MLKMYANAMSDELRRMDYQTVSSLYLVRQFLKRTKRLRSPKVSVVPSLDLKSMLRSLSLPLFEPLDWADLNWFSAKTSNFASCDICEG